MIDKFLISPDGNMWRAPIQTLHGTEASAWNKKMMKKILNK